MGNKSQQLQLTKAEKPEHQKTALTQTLLEGQVPTAEPQRILIITQVVGADVLGAKQGKHHGNSVFLLIYVVRDDTRCLCDRALTCVTVMNVKGP